MMLRAIFQKDVSHKVTLTIKRFFLNCQKLHAYGIICENAGIAGWLGRDKIIAGELWCHIRISEKHTEKDIDGRSRDNNNKYL